MILFNSIISAHRRKQLAKCLGNATQYEAQCASLQTQYDNLQKLVEKHSKISVEASYDHPCHPNKSTGIYWLSQNYSTISLETAKIQSDLANAKGNAAYWRKRYNDLKKLCGDE